MSGKKPSEEVARFIERLNLAARDVPLPEKLVELEFKARAAQGLEAVSPSIEELEAAMAQLPAPKLVTYLRESLYDQRWTAVGQRPSVSRIHYTVDLFNKIRAEREAFYTLFPLIKTEQIGHLRECRLCGRIFFAGRSDQWNCPKTCSQKNRDKEWRKDYKAKKGHSYRPPSREPRHVVRVRHALEQWNEKPGRKSFKSTPYNLKELAADADVSLSQCEAALNSIQQKTVTKSKGKSR